MMKVNSARVKVTAMLPVTLLPPGRKGIKPKRFVINTKKKIVRRKGMYLAYFFSPMDGIATSSLTKRINGSTRDCIPFGAKSFLRVYAFATEINIQHIKNAMKRMEAVFFVMEKSQILDVASSSTLPVASTATM